MRSSIPVQWFGGEAQPDGSCTFFVKDFPSGTQRVLTCQLGAEDGITSPELFVRDDSLIGNFNANLLCDTGAAPGAARLKQTPEKAVIGAAFAARDPAGDWSFFFFPKSFETPAGAPLPTTDFTPTEIPLDPDLYTITPNLTVTAQPCTELSSWSFW